MRLLKDIKLLAKGVPASHFLVLAGLVAMPPLLLVDTLMKQRLLEPQLTPIRITEAEIRDKLVITGYCTGQCTGPDMLEILDYVAKDCNLVVNGEYTIVTVNCLKK